MYEFFKEEGYQPRWVKERKEQGRPEGADPQELARLMREEDYIKPHQIVYFEDPFGKTKYERSNDLENYIGSIIDSIKSIEDAYVTITSREEVFKEFQRGKLSTVELAKFEKKLNLKRASYSTKKKRDILEKWAKVYNCKWLLDSSLTNLVLYAIENQELLPTPLNIKDFITASHDVLDGEQLEDLMKQKSEDTARRFADEIMKMEEDEKVLFLAFAYVGNDMLRVDFVKKMYENIIFDWRESNRKHYRDFETVKQWFEGDKINISEYKIAFSHPSYHEAFQFCIRSQRDESDRMRDIFANVLLRLAHEDEAAGDVASAVAENFDKLPSNIREQLLLKLADNDRAAGGVARGIAYHYNKLPPNVQQLLFKLADNDRTALRVAGEIGRAFDRFPANIREQLLLKLADNDRAAEGVVDAIAANFDSLPPHVHQLLFKLADKDSMRKIVSSAIKEYSDNIPEDIRKEILAKVKKIKKKRRSTRKRLSR